MKKYSVLFLLSCTILFNSNQEVLYAVSNFQVDFDTTYYLQVEPFHGHCQVWATVTNTGSNTEQIIFEMQVTPSEGWSFHSPYYLYLQPGESERPLALSAQYCGVSEQLTADFHIFAMSDTSSSFDISLTVDHAGQPALGQWCTFPIRVQVYDKNTDVPLSNAHVYIWAGRRPEQPHSVGPGRFELMVPPYDTLKSIAQKYNVSWDGFFMEVHCAGYQSYYEDSIVPLADSIYISRNIYLPPLDITADFQSFWYHPLEYPGVWRIVPSEDWNYLAVGMGKHPDPWDVHPCSTKVHLFDSTGTLLWSYPVSEEVWGIDMRGDASLIAAGTSDGILNVIDQGGSLVWEHVLPFGTQIREVRFSHNGDYLCYETSPFKLFNANTGDTIWEFPFLDVHWRGISFSYDDAYIACGGGESLLLLDIAGNFVWERYIGGCVLYYIGFTPGLSKIVVADKGDLLSCFDGSGNLLWRRYIDVLTDAHMNIDGSRVVALSHDGVVRMYDGDGNLLWRRAVDGAGHNGLHMTDDGKYIVVGGGTTNSPYKTMLLDENGNLLWEHSEPGPIPDPYHPYLISAMCVAISQDASCIVSGYGAGEPGIQFFRGEIIGVEHDITRPPATFGLSQNFPNPFSKETVISYQLPVRRRVSLKIHDISGRVVKTLVNEEREPGYHKVSCNIEDLAAGVYFVKFEAGDYKEVRKLILVR